MTDYCTLVSEAEGVDAIRPAVERAVPVAKLELTGAATRWDSLTIRANGGVLRLSAMRRGKPGDAFSRMVLGMHNHFRGAAQASPAGASTLGRIARMCLAIGVVADPSLQEAPWIQDAIVATAQAIDALIFDGNDLLSSDGTPVLVSPRQG